MSKPDLPGGQSLEEILASIRKTLAEDRPDEGLAKLDSGEATGAADPAVSTEGPAAPAGDGLPDQLAVALKGVPNGHADEEDLTDLLASELPAETAPKPRSDAAPGRDPLWFLSGAKPEEADKPRPAAATEEIALTRPETLRRSFPPLFGSGESTPTPSAELPTDRARLAPITNSIPKPVAATRGAAPLASASATATEPPTVVAKPTAALDTRPTPTVTADAAPAVRPQPLADGNAKSAAAGKGEPAPDAAETRAAKADADAPLQDGIARLLEPVIQQWLAANLPRLMQDAIREEVARQVKTQGSGELKI